MSVRQYIGARYVTKIYENSLDPSSAEWESGRAYEPLILVTYNNSSYMSKKQVPANIGDPASNSAYWVCTGYYNGQIASLDSRVDALENDVPVIESQLGLLTDKRVIILGDSYAGRLNNDGKTYPQLIQAALGLSNDDFYLSAQAGCGYTHPDPTNTFLYLLEHISVTDANTITDIYVVGGANDQTSPYASIYTALTAFAASAASRFPNAKIHNICVGITFINTSMSASNTGYLKACKDAAILGFNYAPDAEFTLADSDLLLSDLCHPNAAGVDAIANAIMQYIRYGKCESVSFHDHSTNTANISVEGGVTLNLKRIYFGALRKNGHTQIMSLGDNDNAMFTTSSSVTLSGVANRIDITLDKTNFVDGYFNSSPTYHYGTINDTPMKWTVEVTTAHIIIRVIPSSVTGTGFYIDFGNFIFEM